MQDREVDFDLIQPAGMNRRVNDNQVGISALEPDNAALAPMGGAVVENPKDTLGAAIESLGHHLFDEPIKAGNAIASLAAAEQFCSMYIDGGQVCLRPAAAVLVLDFHHRIRLRRIAEVLAPSGLNAGLFISTQNKILFAKGLFIPEPMIQVQDAASLGCKQGVSRKDPAAVSPRTDSVLVQPAPDGAVADGGQPAATLGITAQIRYAPTRQRLLISAGQFTGQCFDLNDQLWGEKPGADPGGAFLPAPPVAARKSACATC